MLRLYLYPGSGTGVGEMIATSYTRGSLLLIREGESVPTDAVRVDCQEIANQLNGPTDWSGISVRPGRSVRPDGLGLDARQIAQFQTTAEGGLILGSQQELYRLLTMLAAQPLAAQPATVNCPNCGSLQCGDSNFCDMCGNPLKLTDL